jgi:hypothetical protein
MPSSSSLSDGVLEVVDFIEDENRRARRGGFNCVRSKYGKQRDLLAADFLDDVGLDAVPEHRIGAADSVAGDDRELDHVDEIAQAFGAIVELVVAHRHGVKADAVHELCRGLALVGRVEQRALELVTGIKHQHIGALAGQCVAAFVDLGLDAGDAAKALAFRLVLRRAGRIEPVDRLDA